MSEKDTVRSKGTLQLIDGKKYRGELVAGETGAAFMAPLLFVSKKPYFCLL